MASGSRYLTFDLGAESGRALLGTVADGIIQLEEVHRFANEPQRILNRFHWDTVRLFSEIQAGLTRCVHEHTGDLQGIGVDTWGVDFVLLDRNDDILGLPYHYRDSRTDGVMERVFERVSRESIYRTTGIQFMQLNTLYQLAALRFAGSPALDTAHSFLMTPDLLNYWLTGNKTNEFTNATTTQCYDPIKGDWARDILDALDIPSRYLGPVIDPGTEVGVLHSAVREATGARPIPVIAPATHDTGSAVAAVPAATGDGWAYVSCGTWSLVGVEWPHPIINDKSLACNLTNEGGVMGTYRVLRNVMGLWLLQQCRLSWAKDGRDYGYGDLAAMAAAAKPFQAMIDPDHPSFLKPADMPRAIVEFCRSTNQSPPDSVAQMVRCIIEGLALKYRWVLERLEELTGRSIETVHIIGGGSRNELLCQATADASGKRVLAGPVEATALGNVLVQAIATGALETLAAGREAVARSFPMTEYTAQSAGSWDAPYERFRTLLTV
ncbi:MAG: rhamnulokinase [Chthonomonadales bacterium]|nr:rhamnulokinase [Chthonomonadales bacterium]